MKNNLKWIDTDHRLLSIIAPSTEQTPRRGSLLRAHVGNHPVTSSFARPFGKPVTILDCGGKLRATPPSPATAVTEPSQGVQRQTPADPKTIKKCP
jgi:hypothetical protein